MYEAVTGVTGSGPLVQMSLLWPPNNNPRPFMSWPQAALPAAMRIVFALTATEARSTFTGDNQTITLGNAYGPPGGRVNLIVAGGPVTYDYVFVIDRK